MGTVDIARAAAARVTDPELPQLTLEELGVLRGVELEGATVVVSITPTYSGCPAMDVMRRDLDRALRRAGCDSVAVRTVLAPPWSSDWITPEGRRKLAEAGIAPPGAAPRRAPGPVPLSLGPTVRTPSAAAAAHPARTLPAGAGTPVPCPRCGAADTELVSAFSATACKALRRCRECREPFEHLKEV